MLISIFISFMNPTLFISIFEVIFSIYLSIIYKEMMYMSKKSHGVCSCICVETDVMIEIGYAKMDID